MKLKPTDACTGHDCVLSCVGKVPIFQSLTKEEMKTVSSYVKRRTYTKGEMLFLEEEQLNSLFIVHRGKVKISKTTSTGNEHLIRILSTGEFIGEDTLFEEILTDTFAEAIEPTEACVISLKDMQLLINDTPAIGLKLLTEVSRRLKETERLLNILQMSSIEQRVATLLFHFLKGDKSKQTDRNRNSLEINLDVKKGDLAKYIGITPESLSRKLSQFQDKGYIRLVGQRQIIVKNEEALLRIALG